MDSIVATARVLPSLVAVCCKCRRSVASTDHLSVTVMASATQTHPTSAKHGTFETMVLFSSVCAALHRRRVLPLEKRLAFVHVQPSVAALMTLVVPECFDRVD